MEDYVHAHPVLESAHETWKRYGTPFFFEDYAWWVFSTAFTLFFIIIAFNYVYALAKWIINKVVRRVISWVTKVGLRIAKELLEHALYAAVLAIVVLCLYKGALYYSRETVFSAASWFVAQMPAHIVAAVRVFISDTEPPPEKMEVEIGNSFF